MFQILSVRAQQLFTFSAQPDPPPSGPVNFSWFSANNWFTNDPVTQALVHANALPSIIDTAKITGGVNAAANTIHLTGLILNANASVSGGDFQVSLVQMHGGVSGGTTSFNSSIIEVNSEMDVFGSSCALNNSDLEIKLGATAFIGAGGAGQLTYTGSQVSNDGEIILYPNSGSLLTGGTNFFNQSGATILGSSNTFLSGANFDNSGTVRCDSGTMQVQFTTWSSSSGLGKFKTTASNAVISITSTLTVPPGITNIFSGPGVSQLQNGANIQGTVLVGALVGGGPGPILDAGTLQFANQVGGTGTVEVVALPGSPSTFLVNSNVSGTITGLVVNVDIGGQFNVGYNTSGLGLTLLGATINNSGTMTWGGKGSITMNGNATLNNLAPGLFDSQIQNSSTDGTLGNGAPPGGGSFNNLGTFRKSAGTNVILIQAEFNNSGLLDVQSGQAQLYGGSSPGAYNTAPGAELRFGSGSGRTNYLNAGAQFTGTNFVRMLPFNTVVVNGNITIPNFSLEGGTLDGPGNLTVTNVLNWSGNENMQGTGAVNIPINATLNVSGASGQWVQRTINNSGSTIMTNGFVAVGTNAVFNNLANALLEIRKDGGFGFANPTPNPLPVLNNFGTIRTVTPTTVPLAFSIFNQGTVLVQSNQLNCYVYQQNSGTTTISSNATLNPTGMLLQGGVVNGAGAVNGSSVNGFINSGGTLSPGNSPGIFTVSGGTYTQMVAGALSIVIGGTNAGNQYSRLVANGGAVLSGTLSVVFTNGFQPSLGDNYSIITWPSFGAGTGTFSALNGLRAGNGVVLVPVYGGFGVNLVAATDPILTSFAHTGNQFSFSFPTTTGLSNIVEYSDSLNPAIWKPFATNAGDGTIKSATDPFATNATRFYRLRLK